MRHLLAVVFIGAAASSAIAQQQPPTTVQLPTFSFFTVQTSVLVPDSGGAYLGGVSRGQMGSTSRATPFGKGPLLANRGFGSSFQTGGMSVHATIIDNSEIDAAVLAAGLDSQGVDPNVSVEQYAATQRKAEIAALKATEIRAANDLRGAASIADIKQSQLAANDAQQAEARELLLKGDAYAAKNQPGLAKIYYRMAAGKATGDLRRDVISRWAALEPKRASAGSSPKEY